jgi:hypothetical protein
LYRAAVGLQRFLVLFFMELSTRSVEIAARTNGPWMSQVPSDRLRLTGTRPRFEAGD